VEKATIARWTRALQTMFAPASAGESLDAVGGAAGNHVHARARSASDRVAPAPAHQRDVQHRPPVEGVQMTQIGEESGSLDNMLGKVADFYEREVDDAVAALSSLLEPVIIVFLGTFIGGLVIAMYLPIFKLGAVI
jgi:type IV pilus assembly protein PilC